MYQNLHQHMIGLRYLHFALKGPLECLNLSQLGRRAMY